MGIPLVTSSPVETESVPYVKWLLFTNCVQYTGVQSRLTSSQVDNHTLVSSVATVQYVAAQLYDITLPGRRSLHCVMSHLCAMGLLCNMFFLFAPAWLSDFVI